MRETKLTYLVKVRTKLSYLVKVRTKYFDQIFTKIKAKNIFTSLSPTTSRCRKNHAGDQTNLFSQSTD